MSDSEGLSELDEGGIMYVREKIYTSLKAKFEKGEVTTADVDELAQVEGVADDEVMVPVDMKAVGEEFEDIPAMVEKLGAKGTAEAFIKARDLFVENPSKEDDDERPQPMSAKEWREVLEEEELSDGEGLGESDLGDLMEGEEEEFLDNDDSDGFDNEEEEAEDEDGDEDDDEEAQEPAAKKAKTD